MFKTKILIVNHFQFVIAWPETTRTFVCMCFRVRVPFFHLSYYYFFFAVKKHNTSDSNV